MADYINPVIEVDSSEIESDFYDYVQTFYSDWVPREGHLATVLSEAYALAVSDNRSLASDVPPEISRYFGPLFGIDPIDAAPAIGTVTITMVDNVGYTFDPGELLFRIRISGEQYAGFENADPINIPALSTTAVGVTIVATTDGTESNNLSGPVELMTVEDKISTVVLTGGNTHDGLDDENIDDYLNRLSGRLKLLADNVILPNDVEQYIKSIFPAVHRVLVLDNYDPGTDTFGNEKTLTFVPIDENGAAMPGLHASILSTLSLLREWNFVFNAMVPTYTPVTVDTTVIALPGWDLVSVHDTVVDSIADAISPAKHGQPPTGEDPTWILDGSDQIPVSKFFQAIRNVESVNYIDNDTVTINGVDNVPAALAGRAPLPAANPTITVTVLPPS